MSHARPSIVGRACARHGSIFCASALDPLIEVTPSPVTQVVDLQSANFPGHGTLLLFLALYLSVLVTGYHFAVSRGAMRWLLPLASWCAPLLFAPAAYFMFGPVLFDRGASISAVSVIEPLGDSTYAHVQSDLGSIPIATVMTTARCNCLTPVWSLHCTGQPYPQQAARHPIHQ